MLSENKDLTTRPAPPADLEIKDAQLIFSRVWKQLEADYGRERLRFPKELILLGGAPGAGKGTNTDFIRNLRDITAPPIVISQLLDTVEARKVKAQGGMVGDREVVAILLRKLLEPELQNGAVLDGFPRTKVQVECLKLLFDEMIALRRDFSGTTVAAQFKQPIFHIMVLFVDKPESIARQMSRGRAVIAHNEEVKRSGVGELWEERPTDFSEALARNRYRVFKEQTYDALVSLKEIFHYHFINAQAPLDRVQENIVRELEYQSSLELDPRTFDQLRTLPLASEIVRHARQDLVRRLDAYEVENPELFRRVIQFIDEKMMPIVVRHAIPGRAGINSEDPLFEDPAALTMLIDIFSERGYHASVDLHRVEIPSRIDLQTGEIFCRQKKVFRFGVRFRGSTDSTRVASLMSAAASAASRLCSACGMCCDGTMFHIVRLQPGDSAKALAALGLKLKRKRKRDYILQPCPAYRDCRCAIYEDRPERCRLFECKQLRRVLAGEIPEDEAAIKIREAQERVDRLLALFRLAGETNTKGPLTVRHEKILAMPLDPADVEQAALRTRLIQEMQEFEALVQNEFRPPGATEPLPE